VQLQSVLSQEPENSEALNTLGSAFAMRADYRNARGAFEAALRIRPQLVSARVNLARVRAGRIEEASLQLDQALAAAPGDMDTRIAKGQVLIARGRPADAIEYYRRLAAELPGDASVRFNLATLLSQTGRTEDAISEFQAAVRLNPLHPESRNNLGIAFLIAQRYAEAAEQFSEALRLRRQNPEAHNNSGLRAHPARPARGSDRPLERGPSPPTVVSRSAGPAPRTPPLGTTLLRREGF
jgi:tetratricopeptide (TPR) repeat protein